MTEKTTPTIRPNLDKYVGTRTASGAKSKACGDEVADALAGTTLEETYDLVAAVSGTPAGDLIAKYKDRNPGQQRMTLGNILRGALRTKDEDKRTKANNMFTKLAAALRKVVDKRLKEVDSAKEAAKKAADKAKAEKADKAKADKAAKAKEREAKAKETKAKAAEAKAQPKAKPLPPKAAKAPKAPAKPAAKAETKKVAG